MLVAHQSHWPQKSERFQATAPSSMLAGITFSFLLISLWAYRLYGSDFFGGFALHAGDG